MKSEKRQELKEQFVELYLAGKTMQEISKISGCSRNFVGRLIKNDERIKDFRSRKRVKVYKYKRQHRMSVPISASFFEKIGISNDLSVTDFVDIKVDEEHKTIIIKKSEI